MHTLIYRIKRRFSKVFLTLLVSFLILLLLPIAIGSISYVKSVQSLEEERSSINKAMLQQVRQFVDEQIRTVNQLSYEISQTPYIADFLNTRQPLEPVDIDKVAKITRDLGVFSNSTHLFIDDFYIYFLNSNIIVNSRAKYSPETFYAHVCSYRDLPYDLWLQEVLLKDSTSRFFPTKTNYGKDIEENTIVYTQSIPVGFRSSSKATLAMHLKVNYIRDMLLHIKGMDKCQAFILDEDNQVLLSTNPGSPVPVNLKDQESGSSLVYGSNHKDRWIVSYEASKVNQWKYVILTPESVFMEKVKYIKIITLWITLFYLVFGGLVAYYLTKKNYDPLKNIISMIFRKVGVGEPEGTDEYAYITKSFNDVFIERQNLSNTLEEQIPLIKSSFLYQLLRGNLEDEQEIRNGLQSLKLELSYPCFLAAALNLERPDISRVLINRIYIDIYEILDKRSIPGYLVEMEQEIFSLILNLKENDAGDVRKILEQVFEEIRAYLSSMNFTDTTIGIGTFKYDIREVAASYREARKALDYKFVKGTGILIYFDSITESGESYYYPVELEVQLINYVKLGGTDKAYHLLSTILDENFVKRKLSLELAHCLFADVMSTIIKLMGEIKVNFKDVLEIPVNPMEQLLKCQTVHEMRNITLNIFKAVGEYSSQYRLGLNNEMIGKVLAYIAKAYMNENLSLSLMAEDLNINRSYLSRVFKEKTGENMVDYLTKFRVERAKELLEKGEHPIYEVAGLVGYNSVNTLTRLFKRYEGVTPGQYKLRTDMDNMAAK